MTWSEFSWFALPAAVLWLASGAVVYGKTKMAKIADITMVVGVAIFGLFITLFWISLERPPMRTMGETRLWYSFFISAVGYVAYRRWRYPWLLSFTATIATIFTLINIFQPEIHSKTLMPALQSVWFVPHVTAYILSYAMLGAATVGATIALVKRAERPKLMSFIDNMIYIGYGFLMLGLLMGAIWAKEAWGHYWSWDPKETWAFITSASYLTYIHLRLRKRSSYQVVALWLVILSTILLLITWLGVSYLPSAQSSVHVY